MGRLIVPLLPNLITMARILAVPWTVWLMIEGNHLYAFWLFVAAGVSDALDGFIAKRFDAQTVIGGYLDPLADKALLVSVYVTMGAHGDLPLWLVIMVVFRDALIVGGALLFETLTHQLEMAPIAISKINTTAQIVLAGGVLSTLAGVIDFGEWIAVAVVVVAVTTVASGAIYLFTWGRLAIDAERKG